MQGLTLGMDGPWAWKWTPWALGMDVPRADMGSWLGWALGMVGPSWVLEMDGRRAEMGLRYGWAPACIDPGHGWAFDMDGPSPWMGHGHRGRSA